MNSHIEFIKNLNDDQIKTLVEDYMSLSQTGKLLAGSYYYEVCSKVCSMIGTPYNLSILDGMLKIEVYERFVLNK